MEQIFIGFVGVLAGFAVSRLLFRRKKSESTPYDIYIDGPNGQKLTGYMAKEIEKRSTKREG